MKIDKIHIGKEFVDERGFISRVLDEKGVVIKSVLHIERKKGAIGGNHYHKKDAHYIYVLSGKIKYIEKDMGEKESHQKTTILKPGDLVLSSPMTAHYTEFLEDTVFLAFATEHRSQEEYEADTVRLDFVTGKSK